MNNLDKQYTALLQDILDNGVTKQDRTGTGTLSVFGRQIRHKMSEGFPLLTTKKMYFKGVVTELIWFLRGDTNIKYLVANNCHIWDGDAYKNYRNKASMSNDLDCLVRQEDGSFLKEMRLYTQEEFINKIKTDDEFAEKWGDLGPIYGAQWRDWLTYKPSNNTGSFYQSGNIDQIANLINDLKTNPDGRRIMVTAWNPAELDQMTLPPCHYGFQVYTRELSLEERLKISGMEIDNQMSFVDYTSILNGHTIPTRAISLMWNQRSVDTFLGLPFNIASYGLLLEIIAKAVNMVPDELIGNLGDTHLYLNHVEQAKEQIGRELSLDERTELAKGIVVPLLGSKEDSYNEAGIPTRTREPYPLPTLNINTEWWPTESGECGIGPIDAAAVVNGFSNDHFCKCLMEEDIQLGNYQSHPAIKAPLSN